MHHYSHLNDRDIGRMTPRCLKIELEQINEFRLEQSLMEYIRAGNKISKLPPGGALAKKYREMTGAPAIGTVTLDDAVAEEIDKMHEDLKNAADPKAELNKLIGGLN